MVGTWHLVDRRTPSAACAMAPSEVKHQGQHHHQHQDEQLNLAAFNDASTLPPPPTATPIHHRQPLSHQWWRSEESVPWPLQSALQESHILYSKTKSALSQSAYHLLTPPDDRSSPTIQVHLKSEEKGRKWVPLLPTFFDDGHCAAHIPWLSRTREWRRICMSCFSCAWSSQFKVSYIFYDHISSASIACSNIWNCDRL